MVYFDFQRSENVKKKKTPTKKEIPTCYSLARVFISRVAEVYGFLFFLPFLGLQRETDSVTTTGLEDTVSERHIQPLLGYDWIAGKLFG